MQAIFLDIETTGLDPLRHSPLDIAIEIVDLSSLKRLGSYQSSIRVSKQNWESSDPVSVQINGFTLERAESGVPLQQVRSEVMAFFEQHQVKRGRSFFICQNPPLTEVFLIILSMSTLRKVFIGLIIGLTWLQCIGFGIWISIWI